jgi:HK97 family phage portal protein
MGAWGDLASAVDAAKTHARKPDATRDLAQVMDQHIAWQGTGLGPDRAMSLPALFAVVRLIGSTIDQLPITVDGGPAPEWLRKPRRYGSALDQGDLIAHTVASMALHGAGYLLARRVGESWRLDAVHHSSVGVQSSTGGVVDLRFTLEGEAITRVPALAADWRPGVRYLVHVPYLVTPQQPWGASPVTEAAESIAGYLAVEKQAATLLEKGDHYGGWLSTDSDITADTARRFQDTWTANRKAGRVPVLGAGLDWNPGTNDPDSAQWLESRLANAQMVASLYGVPPDMLGMTMAGGGSSLSYSNSQDNNARFRANCLEAFTTQLADSLTGLLPTGRGPGEEQAIAFDYSEWEGTTNAAPAVEG